MKRLSLEGQKECKKALRALFRQKKVSPKMGGFGSMRTIDTVDAWEDNAGACDREQARGHLSGGGGFTANSQNGRGRGKGVEVGEESFLVDTATKMREKKHQTRGRRGGGGFGVGKDSRLGNESYKLKNRRQRKKSLQKFNRGIAPTSGSQKNAPKKPTAPYRSVL